MALPLLALGGSQVAGMLGGALSGSSPAVPSGGGVRTEVRVDGLREFRRDLKRLDPAADKQLRIAIRDAVGKIAAEAAATAPRRSGAYARSIRPYVSGARASVGSTLPYAGVVHFGGTISPRGVPITFKPQPDISRAVDRRADQLVEDIGDGIERAAVLAGWR